MVYLLNPAIKGLILSALVCALNRLDGKAKHPGDGSPGLQIMEPQVRWTELHAGDIGVEMKAAGSR